MATTITIRLNLSFNNYWTESSDIVTTILFSSLYSYLPISDLARLVSNRSYSDPFSDPFSERLAISTRSSALTQV